MLSVSRLYRVDDRMTNEYGAVGGMQIDRGTEVLRESQPNATLETTNAI
jgi:hypothetical protein